LERRQDDPELWSELGLARLRSGATGPGADALSRSLELRPSAVGHYNLGNAQLALGQVAQAVAEFERAVALDPDLVPAANNLAWLLATNPDTALRDGGRAVELAERVCGGEAGRTASNLDTLAAAYAESGRFDDAVEAADEAIRLAKAAGDIDTARGVQQRKSAYLQGQAHRDG
jgi:tetratricopeptide (TPR) repeat protein